MDGQGRAGETGQYAEQAALAFLQGQGLKLVERNFRCRRGELDLIMRDGATLVFVEVRYRADRRFGGALASIGSGKRRRLRAAAEYYLQGLHRAPPPCRFDVVAMDGGKGGAPTIQWLRNSIDGETP